MWSYVLDIFCWGLRLTHFWMELYDAAYSVLLTHDNLCKPTLVKQVVMAAIVILNSICRAWTMYLRMDSVKFLLEAPDAELFGRAS